jgi:hypothetical protein
MQRYKAAGVFSWGSGQWCQALGARVTSKRPPLLTPLISLQADLPAHSLRHPSPLHSPLGQSIHPAARPLRRTAVNRYECPHTVACCLPSRVAGSSAGAAPRAVAAVWPQAHTKGLSVAALLRRQQPDIITRAMTLQRTRSTTGRSTGGSSSASSWRHTSAYTNSPCGRCLRTPPWCTPPTALLPCSPRWLAVHVVPPHVWRAPACPQRKKAQAQQHKPHLCAASWRQQQEVQQLVMWWGCC